MGFLFPLSEELLEGGYSMRYAPCSLLFASFVASRPMGPVL